MCWEVSNDLIDDKFRKLLDFTDTERINVFVPDGDELEKYVRDKVKKDILNKQLKEAMHLTNQYEEVQNNFEDRLIDDLEITEE